MFGSGPVMILAVVWAVVTAVFIVLMIYRSLIGMHEDDQLFLEATESQMEREQRLVQSKIMRVTPFAKGFGFASLGLLLVTCGLWVYETLKGSSLLP